MNRGPRRLIAAYYPRASGGQTVELVCGHSVVRRRVLIRQTVTNCERCRDAWAVLDQAIARARTAAMSADDSDPRA